MYYLNNQAEFVEVDEHCNAEDARWELSEEFSIPEHQVYVVRQAGQFGRNRLDEGSLCQNGVILMLHTAQDLERVERQHGRAALLHRLKTTWARLYPTHGGAPDLSDTAYSGICFTPDARWQVNGVTFIGAPDRIRGWEDEEGNDLFFPYGIELCCRPRDAHGPHDQFRLSITARTISIGDYLVDLDMGEQAHSERLQMETVGYRGWLQWLLDVGFVNRDPLATPVEPRDLAALIDQIAVWNADAQFPQYTTQMRTYQKEDWPESLVRLHAQAVRGLANFHEALWERHRAYIREQLRANLLEETGD